MWGRVRPSANSRQIGPSLATYPLDVNYNNPHLPSTIYHLPTAMTRFTIRRLVEFQDTDMAGIMHFTAYFRFMEAAEHAFLRSRGLSVFLEDDEGKISWPRVAVHCDYTAPARFSEELEIEVRVARLSRRSVTYDFLFYHDGRQLAQGTMTSVCCRFPPDAPPHSIAIPPAIRAQLE